MTFLAAQPIEQRQAQQIQALTPSDPEGLEPGFFSGAPGAVGTALGRVAGVASQLGGELIYKSGVTATIDALFDTDLTGFADLKLRQEPAQLTASMTPDPYTTGTLGQILYGFVGIGLPAAVGTFYGGPAGGAALAGGFQTVGTYTDLTQQGVDPNTAAGAAAFDGSLVAVGVGAPAAIGGRALLNTLVYGPGINVAQDLIASQGISSILEQRGYTEMADRYASIEAEMIAADILLGAAFGWGGARSNRSRGGVARAAPTVSDIDAGLTAMAQRHVEIDTAPGIPANLAAVQAHTRNLAAATEAMLDGRPIEAEPMRGKFLDRPAPAIPAPSEFVRAIRDSGLPGLLDDIDALEAELARRGRSVDEGELPDVRRVAAADPAAIETAAETGPLKVVERDVGGVKVREIEQTRAAVDAAEATGKAGDLLRAVGKHAAGDDQRMLAGRLASVADKAGLSVIRPPEGARHAGAYMAGEHAIYIQQAKPSIVLHEALHGVTSALLDSPEARASNPQVRAAYDDMRGILNDAQAALREADMAAMPAALREMLNDPQGPLSNIKELLTYGFTEKEFQRWLDTVPASKKAGAATAWQTFKDAIKRLIGKLSPGERTLLDELIESGGRLINAAEADPAAVKRAAGPRAAGAEGGTMAERVAADVVAENPGLTLPAGMVDYAAVSFADDVAGMGGRQYPLAPPGARYEETDIAPTMMTPDEFLSRVKPLEIDDASRDNIDDLKEHIKAGRVLDPLHIRKNGKEDGRHRAVAAKELGIALVPVIDEFVQPRIDYAKINTAADALEQADAAIARAENDAVGFEAAIACFMRNGA